MYDDVLIRHSAPTLAGIKTASLFPCVFQDALQMRVCLRKWNGMLVKKGLCILPLRCTQGSALLYIYRASMLRDALAQRGVRQLLQERGYCCRDMQSCIRQLIARLQQSGDFPHEIGVFLGYPLHDVRGFIQNRACNFRCAGCWKVYADERAAMQQFCRFGQCTKIYCAQYAKGMSIERLTVAG